MRCPSESGASAASVRWTVRRRSSRLAAKEPPLYIDTTTKATRVKEASFDMSKASERLKAAISDDSSILARPVPSKVSIPMLKSLGHACGLSNLFEVEEEPFCSSC